MLPYAPTFQACCTCLGTLLLDRGERETNRTEGRAAVEDFQAFVDAGITTFDTADIYGELRQCRQPQCNLTQPATRPLFLHASLHLPTPTLNHPPTPTCHTGAAE